MMHDTTEMIRVLAWPLTALLFLFVLRSELKSFARNIGDRILSAESLNFGPKGLNIKGGLAGIVPPEVQARKLKLRGYILGVEDRRILDPIADVFGVASNANLDSEKADIIVALASSFRTNKDMDKLATKLKNILRQDF